MDRLSFESAEPILDDLAELVDQSLDSDQLAAVREALVRLSEAVGPGFSVNLTVTVDIFDPDRPHALRLLTTGLSTSEGQPTYRTWGDSTTQKYVVKGVVGTLSVAESVPPTVTA